jgi:hypothetical protein
MAKKPAKTDKAPKPVSVEPEGKEERLSDITHSEELSRMVGRLDGLSMALTGLQSICVDVSGAGQLADDIYDKMQACAEAFEAERLLRMTPAQRARFEQVLNMAEEDHQ